MVLSQYVDISGGSASHLRPRLGPLPGVAQSLVRHLHGRRTDPCNSLLGCNPTLSVLTQATPWLDAMEGIEKENVVSGKERRGLRDSRGRSSSRIEREDRAEESSKRSAGAEGVVSLQSLADFSDYILRWEGMGDDAAVRREIAGLAREIKRRLPRTDGAIVLVQIAALPEEVRQRHERRKEGLLSARGGIPLGPGMRKEGVGEEGVEGGRRAASLLRIEEYVFARIVGQENGLAKVCLDGAEEEPDVHVEARTVLAVPLHMGQTDASLRGMAHAPLQDMYNYILGGIDREVHKVAKLYGVDMRVLEDARRVLAGPGGPAAPLPSHALISGGGSSLAQPSRRISLSTTALMLSKTQQGRDGGGLLLEHLPFVDIPRVREELQTISDLISRKVFSKSSAHAEAQDSIMAFVAAIPPTWYG